MKVKEILLIVVIVAVLCTTAYAYFAYEAITVSSTAIGLTATQYQYAHRAYMTLEGNNVRWTMDAVTTPTSAGVGHLWYVGQSLMLEHPDELRNFRAIRSSATDATIKVTYRSP